MKKYIILYLCIGLGGFFLTSCQKYLDKAPAAGVNQGDIFNGSKLNKPFLIQ